MSACASTLQPLVEIRLHGHLRARFGRVFHLAVETPAEAINALSTQIKGFADAVRGWAGPGYRLRVGDGDRADWRDEHTARLGLGQARRIDIVPSVSGAKRQGWGQVIVGAVLVVVGGIISYGSYGSLSAWGAPMAKAGWALMIGGAMQLLTPIPRGSGSKASQEASQQLSGPPNITSPGGPVPLIIGRCLVGSVTVSAGMSTDEVVKEVVLPPTPELSVDEPQFWEAPGGGDAGDAGGDGPGAAGDGSTGIGSTGNDGTGAVGVSAGDA
jgi:predicted phage tail protein